MADPNISGGSGKIAQGYGWIGGVWQKQPLLFGYSQRLTQRLSNTSLPAGASNINDTAIPAGEVHVLTSIALRYVGTPPTYIQVVIIGSPGSATLFYQAAPVSGQWYDRQGWYVLGPTDILRGTVVGATLNDDLYLDYNGFIIDIDQ